MESLIGDPRIGWSAYQDPSAEGDTVLRAVERSGPEIRASFFQVLRSVREQLNRHQSISVHWWYAPLVYVEVEDSRWKHYPCNRRMLISFDLTNGKCASLESRNHYAYARKGWRSVAKRLAGENVREFSDCGCPESTDGCKRHAPEGDPMLYSKNSQGQQ
jgi:hypothetical protein